MRQECEALFRVRVTPIKLCKSPQGFALYVGGVHHCSGAVMVSWASCDTRIARDLTSMPLLAVSVSYPALLRYIIFYN